MKRELQLSRDVARIHDAFDDDLHGPCKRRSRQRERTMPVGAHGRAGSASRKTWASRRAQRRTRRAVGGMCSRRIR